MWYDNYLGVNLVYDKVTNLIRGNLWVENLSVISSGMVMIMLDLKVDGVIMISKDSSNAYAKILSSGVNQDGSSNWLTASDMNTQSDLIRDYIRWCIIYWVSWD